MRLFLASALASFLSAQPAFAYLDPGTGTILLQGIIAALSTLFVSIALGWNYIKGKLSSLKRRLRGE